jgi:hypothetical protein
MVDSVFLCQVSGDDCIGPRPRLYGARLYRPNGERVDRCTSSLQTSSTGRWKWRSGLRLRQWQLGTGGPGCQAPQSGRVCHWTTLWVKGKAVAKHVAPDATAVPWLLLESVGGTGRLGAVRFIQRTGTRGGNAPDGSCSQSAMRRVPYTATYSFYGAGQ